MTAWLDIGGGMLAGDIGQPAAEPVRAPAIAPERAGGVDVGKANSV
jgi:hypothetical protein